MKYQVNIVRYEADKPILLKSIMAESKQQEVSWDNKTYPVKTELVSYVDVDKKIGYIFFEHDNINQMVLLDDSETKALLKVPLTELGDVDKKKLNEMVQQKTLDNKKSLIMPMRLYHITKMALTASEYDMHVNQNVIASIFSRLKNFASGNVGKTTLIIVLLVGGFAGMIGFFVGGHFAPTETVIKYLNSTQSTIPTV